MVDQYEKLVREVVDRIVAAANEDDELARLGAGVLGFALPQPIPFVTQMRTVLREIVDWFYAPVGWEGHDGNDFGATTYNPEFNATPNVIAFRFSEKYDDRLRGFERVLESIPLRASSATSPGQAANASSADQAVAIQSPATSKTDDCLGASSAHGVLSGKPGGVKF